MTTNLSSPHKVILDASFIIGLCAKEPGKYPAAQAILRERARVGCTFHAPCLLIMEAVYVLCGKRQGKILSDTEHAAAIASLQSVTALMIFPAGGDASLINRAEKLREGYGCSHSADCLYIALAEQLAVPQASELITFDAGQYKQAVILSPIIAVTLLTP